MSLIYNGGVAAGRISLNRFVPLVSTAPAELFRLFPKKGTIAVGSDADIVVFDPKAEMAITPETHHVQVDYNAYDGIVVTGVTATVLSRGKVVIEQGKDVGTPGGRRFRKRSPLG